ncbi:MAG: hypothetical protein WKG01_25980 [Kofleriaceae bacterium]
MFKFVSIGLTLVSALSPASADAPKAESAVTAHVLRPAKLDPTAERLATLKLPSKFVIEVFADGLEKPRMLAVAKDGTVYVTRREPGDVWMLKDADGDGRAEIKKKLVTKQHLHGIALHGNDVYLIAAAEVFTTRRLKDGSFGPLKTLITDLPSGGQHNNRTAAVCPDGKLYISVGSTCNACKETGKESATLLQLDRTGKHRKVFASGLRNTIGSLPMVRCS